MPVYEYVCKTCSRQFEELVFGESNPQCPHCQGAEVERVLSVVSVGQSNGGAPSVPAESPCGRCPGGGGGGCPYSQ